MGFDTKKKPSGKTNMKVKKTSSLKNTNSSKRKVSTDIRPQSK